MVNFHFFLAIAVSYTRVTILFKGRARINTLLFSIVLTGFRISTRQRKYSVKIEKTANYTVARYFFSSRNSSFVCTPCSITVHFGISCLICMIARQAEEPFP